MVSKLVALLSVFLLVAGVASATAPSLCTISGTVYNADGSTDNNDTITIIPNPATQTINGNNITAQPISVQTNASGALAAFTLVQGLTVNISYHNNTAGVISTFVPNSPASVWGNFITASSSITPVSFCASPVTFGGLPGSPQVGSTCTVTDATACNIGVPVTVGGGGTGCQLTWVGSNWFPSGGATIAPGSLPFPPAFPLTATANFNNYSGINIADASLTKLSQPTSVSVTATCTGACATTYTYEVTCRNDLGVETGPSAPVTGTNAASLSAVNFNVVSWAPAPACNFGYNIYGRISGSLVLIGQVASGTTSFADKAGSATPASYTLTWAAPAYPAVAVWDIRGETTTVWPVDQYTSNGGNSATQAATGFTSTANHDLEIPIFGTNPAGLPFTPPAGFSNTVSVPEVATSNMGIWGGANDIAVAGAVPTRIGSTLVNNIWATFHFGFLAANPSVAQTIVGTTSAISSNPFTSVSVGDPTGALSGDLELICAAWGTVASNTLFPYPPAASAGLILLGTIGDGESGQVMATPTTNVTCYLNSPTTSASGIPPPTANLTGSILQTTPTGSFEETLLGIIPWSGDNMGVPNVGSGTVLKSTSFPMALTVYNCRVSWAGWAGCGAFPTFALKDVTTNTVLCSSGTVSITNTDAGVTPSNTVLHAFDELALVATATGSGCSGGLASLSAVFKE